MPRSAIEDLLDELEDQQKREKLLAAEEPPARRPIQQVKAPQPSLAMRAGGVLERGLEEWRGAALGVQQQTRGAVERAIAPPSPEEAYGRSVRAQGGVITPKVQSEAVRQQILAKEGMRAKLQAGAANVAGVVAEAAHPLLSPEQTAITAAFAPVGPLLGKAAPYIATGAKYVRGLAAKGPSISEAAKAIKPKSAGELYRETAAKSLADRKAREEAAKVAVAPQRRAEGVRQPTGPDATVAGPVKVADEAADLGIRHDPERAWSKYYELAEQARKEGKRSEAYKVAGEYHRLLKRNNIAEPPAELPGIIMPPGPEDEAAVKAQKILEGMKKDIPEGGTDIGPGRKPPDELPPTVGPKPPTPLPPQPPAGQGPTPPKGGPSLPKQPVEPPMPPPKPPSAKAPGAALPAIPEAKVIIEKLKRKRAAPPVTIQERYQEEVADFAGVPPSFETWLERRRAGVGAGSPSQAKQMRKIDEDFTGEQAKYMARQEAEAKARGEIGGIKLGAPLREPVAKAVKATKEKMGAFAADAKENVGFFKNLYVRGFTDARGLPEKYIGAKKAFIGRTLQGRDEIMKIAHGMVAAPKGWRKVYKTDVRDLRKTGLTDEDEAQIARFRWSEERTPAIEREVKKLLDSWGGGRAATIKRLEAKKSEVTQMQHGIDDMLAGVDEAQFVKDKNRRLKELDEAMDRLRSEDKPPVIKSDKRSEELAELVIPSIQKDFENAQRAVKIGLASEEAMIKQAGKYQAKLYDWDEIKTVAQQMGVPLKVVGKHFKERLRTDDVDPKDLEKMYDALVKDKPAWTFGLPAYKTQRDIEAGIMFKELAGDKSVALSRAAPGFVQMPDSKGYGALRGMYVQEEVAADLKSIFEPNRKAILDQVMREIMDPVLQGWAFGKTVLSPATQARNVMSGTAMYFVAAGDISSPRNMLAAYRAMRGGGKLWEEGIKSGLDLRSIASGEMRDWFDDISPNATTPMILRRLVKAGTNLPINKQAAKLYQATDAFFKLAIFDYAKRDLKMGSREAAKYVGMYYPDYRDVSAFWEQAGKRGFPLMTFAYKTAQHIPRLATGGMIGGQGKRLAGRPGSMLSVGLPGGGSKYGVRSDIAATARFTAVVSAGLWLKDIFESKTGFTPEQIRKIKDIQPQYVNEGLYLFSPFKAKNGEVKYLDLTYATPWPMLTKLANNAGFSDPMEFAKSILPTNPVLQSIYAASEGYDTFSKRRIWSEEVEQEARRGSLPAKAERKAKFKSWWTESAMPNLYPGGHGWNRVEAAAKGEEYRGQTQTMGEALGQSVGGIRTQKVDLKRSEDKRRQELSRVIDNSKYQLALIRKDLASGRLKATPEVMKRRVRLESMAQEARTKLQELSEVKLPHQEEEQ